MGIVVGGPNARKVRRIGEFVLAFQYVNDEEAMVLYPARPSRSAGAFVVCLSSAYKYAGSNGYPTKYMLEQAVTACKVMDMQPGRSTLRAIIDVIVDGLVDLIEMKPMPAEFEQPMGEVEVQADGNRINLIIH